MSNIKLICIIFTVCSLMPAFLGSSFADRGQCPNRMSLIPGGMFMAGEVKSLKRMNIDTFCIDNYEVTQGEFESVMGKNPSKFKGINHPVENVTWNEAKLYCGKLGKRLPTEWEWEKAAKAGTLTKYYWGDYGNLSYAWYGEDWKTTHSHPVGQKTPNGYDLYDMSGNVSEWTSTDEFDLFGNNIIVRGGAWLTKAKYLRSAYRNGYSDSGRSDTIGFRCIQ
jgi:formylglycine-generating enzyme